MVWHGMVSLNVRCRGAPGPTLLMPAPEALCLRVALMSEMLVAQGEETVCGSSCNWIHKDCDVARLQQRGLAAVVHEHGHVSPDAAVVHDLQETATHVGLTWCQCNPRRWRLTPSETPPVLQLHMTFSAAKSSEQTVTREDKSSWGSFGARAHQSTTRHWVLQKKLDENGKTDLPVRHGPDQARKTAQEHHPALRCDWKQAGNPTARHAEPIVFQESEHQVIH